MGNWLGVKSVAMYTSAVQISSIIGIVPAIIVGSIFPRMMNAKAESEEAYRRVLTWATQLLIAIYLPFLIFIYLGADLIIGFLFGAEFVTSATILRIHVLGFFFVFLGSIAGTWIVMENKNWLSLTRSLIGFILNIILNWWLILKYAGVGAAIASAVSQAVTCYFLYGLFPSCRKIFVLQTKAVVKLLFTFKLEKL